MTANSIQVPNEVPRRSFWPECWDHLKSEFVVTLVVTQFWHSEFALVKRLGDGRFEVWCRGLGEECVSAAHAVHHIRLLARELGGLQ